jgi:hypothetical protein
MKLYGAVRLKANCVILKSCGMLKEWFLEKRGLQANLCLLCSIACEVSSVTSSRQYISLNIEAECLSMKYS